MVIGVSKFRRRMRAIPKHVKDDVAKVMEEEAEKIVQMMRSLVPVKSGDLKESIGWTWGEAPKGSFVVRSYRRKDGKKSKYSKVMLTIYAGNETAFYARYVEFGTKHGKAAQPFFYPAYRANRTQAKSRITRAVRRAMKKGPGNG